MFRLRKPYAALRKILEGRYDDVPEAMFLNAGSIDDVAERYSREDGKKN